MVTPESDDDDLLALVGEWLTLPDVAARLGMPVTRVRQLLADGELLAVRIGEPAVLRVPARFLTGAAVRPDLVGTVTLLEDGGMDAAQAIRWLFTPSDDYTVPGAPMDALEAGLKKQVRRQAQLTAF